VAELSARSRNGADLLDACHCEVQSDVATDTSDAVKINTRLVKEVFDRIASGLANLRFQQREVGVFTIPISNEAGGWVGLNKRLEGGKILQVNPVVGVRNHRLEEFIARARYEVPHPYLPPSISVPLGYLMPHARFSMWDFAEDSRTDEVVGDLLKNIRDYAMPFMYSNSRLDDIYNQLRKPRFYSRDKADYYIPAIDTLLDRNFSAKEFVTAKIVEMSDRTDQAAEHYREFARAIVEFRKGDYPSHSG